MWDDYARRLFITFPTTILGFSYLLYFAYALYKSIRNPKGKLPPGPKPKPIIGNLLDFPPHESKQSEHWAKHYDLYGPISSLSVMGKKIIIVNHPSVARELLEKRSAKWSERPIMTFAGEMCGFDQGMIFSVANDRFREMRKVSHNQLGSLSSLQKWSSEIDIEVRRYLFRVMEDPRYFTQHIRKEAGSIILRIVYGYNVEPYGKDALVDIMEKAMDIFVLAAVPGAWTVDMIPALRYLPEWLPGMKFKRTAREWRKTVLESAIIPFEFAKRQMASGDAAVSLVSESLKKLGPKASSDDLRTTMWAAVSMFAGGADTTVAQMEWFYLAMILFPEVQRKAQAEIDAVVGKGRLPEPSDRPNLPYIEAVLKECFRWETIGEVLIPHASCKDDYYEDYFIPKGSMMLVNNRYRQDPTVYPEPDIFRPERYLGENCQPNPMDNTWGFGRRTCPGRWLATTNLWLQISRTLAVFDIKAVNGKEPTRAATYGVVRRPLPFDADIKVRSPEHEELIREVTTMCPFPEHGDGNLL